MPEYKMQYEDKDGNKLDKPIKVLVHKTEPAQPGGQKDLPADKETSAEKAQQDAELLSFLNAQAVEEKPNVSDLKPDFAWVTKDRRDEVWEIYTLESTKEES